MNIMSLPDKHEFIHLAIPERTDEVLATRAGWFTTVWQPIGRNCPPAVLQITPDSVRVAFDNYRILTNSTMDKIVTIDYWGRGEHCAVYLNPSGEHDKLQDYTLENFQNKNYYCFVNNPGETKPTESDIINYTRALLSLAGISPKDSVAVIYDKKEHRSVAFKNPLDEPLRTVVPSLDGLTILMLSRNFAAVIDNPLL